eukprot:916350-Pyramimonas_sp.AAC.1
MRRVEAAPLTAARLFAEITPAVAAKEAAPVFQRAKQHAKGNASHLPLIASIDVKGLGRTLLD